jgi:predicted NBD/HSP70 family sugar kinase
MVSSRNAADKATPSQLRNHNRQLLLRAIYTGMAETRVALAQQTGLAKPTVSEVIAELMDAGLLVEEGRGPSTEGGGKRPRLLRFVPTARQVIGISITEERVEGALAFLDGRMVAQHYLDLEEPDYPTGEAAIDAVFQVLNGLIAQLDAPLLSVGVGVSGVVDAERGLVSYMPCLEWHNVPLAQRLEAYCEAPVYIANSTELAAMAQYVFGLVGDVNTLATVLVGGGVGVGLVISGSLFHGGGEIGHLRLAHHLPGASGDLAGTPLEALLGWRAVKARARVLQREFPGDLLPGPDERLTYMHLGYAAANGDPAALALLDELSGYLAQVFAWIIGLLRPDHITLAGPITNAGPALLERTIERTQQLVLPDLAQSVSYSLTESTNLVAVGAIAQALQRELGVV